MLQKILVILVGLAMSLIGALTPEGLFAAQDPNDGSLGLDLAGSVREETLATVRLSDKVAFAKVPILWAEVDGRRVAEDAWGTGEVKELRFKVGVKGVEGTALMVGERQVPLMPTDVLTVRTFQGDFSFRGLGTPQATLQLQGDVKTTTLSKGESTNRLLTQRDSTPAEDARPDDGRVAYVVLTTGGQMDTVALQQGGARFVTQEATSGSDAAPAPGNLLAKWVRIDGKLVREYTWGEGSLGSIEFEAVEGDESVLVAYDGAAAPPQGGRVSVKDFVGEYLVYQVAGGQVRLRLDGYAADFSEGAYVPPPTSVSAPGAPVAAFDFSPSNPRTTDTIRFRDLSVAPEGSDIVLRRWDFGDGSADVRRDPTHRYDKPGVYEVTLDVTDLDVRVSQVKRTITVRNAEPVPDFEFAPKRIYSGSLVSFTDLSRDLDGAVLNWTWDFGDGEVSHARHPVHRFSRGGNHTVTLTVGDDLQGVVSLSKTVVVLNTAPTASFTYAPDAPVSQAPVQFFDNSTDPDGTIVSWEWSFGDGARATGPTPTYAFPKPGPYVVTLIVTDNAGGSTTTTQPLVVQNRAPRADFIWSPMGAPAETPVEFKSTSTDADGLVLLTSWDFGDGSAPARDTPVNHIFPRAGTYNVTVTVTDNFLATSSLTRSVTIANAAPRADFSASPDPTFRQVPVTFADLSTDPDGDPIAERLWDFGDGTPVTDTAALTTHVYDRLGSFSVTLRVKDDKGNQAYATRPLTVLNRPPTGSFTWDPAIPIANRPVFLNATGIDSDSPGTLTFRWHFADGSTATGQYVDKVFTTPGPQTVVLRIHDSEGGISIPIVRTLGVNLAPPLASFAWTPPIPTTDESVTFNDTSTSTNGAIRSREWFINGEGVSSGGNPFYHTFGVPDTYMVSLRVTDEAGAVEWYHHNVTVNGRPEAIFEAPIGQVPLNEAITFQDRSRDPEKKALAYRWDFGDGTPVSNQPGNVTHAYTTPGPKTVTLTVTDDKGASDVETRVVTVLNRRPVARWDLATTDPRAGQDVSFISTGRAFDPDGSAQIQSWTWNFGDGGSAATADPTHVFAHSGLYTVNLQVTDGLLKSNVEPGSYRLIRIGADHPLTVTVVGKFPDGRDAPLLANRFALTGSFGQLATGFRDVSKSEFVPNGSALDLRFEPGQWLTGDQIIVGVKDTLFMDFPIEKMATFVESDGLATSVKLLFEFPLPLRATVDVEAGAGALGILPVNPFLNGTHTEDGEPIYRSPVEQFHGTGRVTFIDDVPVHRADVTLFARYVPTAFVGTAQDAADLGGVGGLGILGWCRAATATTDANGDYEWTFAGVDCLPTALSAYPLGRWEIRALATYRTATSDYSDSEGVWVDPTGGNLSNLPLP